MPDFDDAFFQRAGPDAADILVRTGYLKAHDEQRRKDQMAYSKRFDKALKRVKRQSRRAR
jgi:hypothetical protein